METRAAGEQGNVCGGAGREGGGRKPIPAPERSSCVQPSHRAANSAREPAGEKAEGSEGSGTWPDDLALPRLAIRRATPRRATRIRQHWVRAPQGSRRQRKRASWAFVFFVKSTAGQELPAGESLELEQWGRRQKLHMHSRGKGKEKVGELR